MILGGGLVAVVTAVAAADFDLYWHTVDGGGAMFSSGGTFELSGTIGQQDASVAAMTGGTFALTGGFWAGAGVALPGDCDDDGDVDWGDYQAFAACLLGPNVPTLPNCTCYNLDGDVDVDVDDFARFQDAFTGP